MVDQENSHLLLHNLTSQFLECPLCFDNYVNPKILPCQHTCCLECLKDYVATNGFSPAITCPVCRESIEVPDNDVTNFKNNFYIVSLLNFVENSEKKNVQDNESTSITKTSRGKSSSTELSSGKSLSLCGACHESETLSTFCQECSLELCLYCTKAHRRVPATTSHKLLTSQQLNRKCTAEVERCKSNLTERENRITFNHEFLLNRTSQLPVYIAEVKKSIESTAEAAHQIIRKKAIDLLQEVESFCTEQNDTMLQGLTDIEVEKQRLANIKELLASMRLSDDGFKNQVSLRQVQRYIADTSRDPLFPLLSKIFDIIFLIDGSILKSMKDSNLGTIYIS